MLAESKREKEARREHNEQVTAAHEAAAVEAEKNHVRKMEEDRKNAVSLISKGNLSLLQAEAEILQLEADIKNEEGAATSALRSARMHVGTSNIYRGDLAQKRNELDRIQREIIRLESSL